MNEDNDENRRIVEHCYRTRKTLLNPIVDWTDEDVWEFIKTYDIPYCELYDRGYTRLGCIGCPMNTAAAAELDRYPKYKKQYIRAFDKMLKEFNNPPENWTDGQAVMDWWLGKKPKAKEIDGQINIFEQEIVDEIMGGDG